MKKCIVIDDEQMAREIIAALISNSDRLELVGEFPDAIEAMKYLNKNEVDLIFLDIHMPNFNGFDFIQTIKNPPQIILFTSDENFAIDAFEYDCITDYLVKPITEDRFNRSLERVFKKKTGEVKAEFPGSVSHSEIYVNINSRLIKIGLASINSIQAKGDYVLIKTEDKNYIVHTTLKKIREKLPKNTFLSIHRSHIINIDKIIDIQDNSVLIDKEVIPISKRNREDLMRSLNLL